MAVKLRNARGAERILPITYTLQELPLRRVVPTVRRGGGDGSVLAGQRTLEPRQFALRGTYYHPDKATLHSQVDDILAFLQADPVEVYRDASDTWHLLAYVTDATPRYIDGGAEVELPISLLALDPLWRGAQASYQTTVTAALQQFTVAGVLGTAPTPPYVILTADSGANFTDPVLEHRGTGKAVQLLGTFVAGDRVEIDSERFLIVKNGQVAMNLAHGDWLRTGFHLHPGDNLLEFRATGTVNVTVSLTWRARKW